MPSEEVRRPAARTDGCYLSQLVLDNFKSYAGTHTIPLDPKLTCVIGPNGSGTFQLCLRGFQPVLISPPFFRSL